MTDDCVLVTGATNGIGLAVARPLVSAQQSCLLMVGDAEALAAAAGSLGDRAVAVVGSAVSLADCERAVAAGVKQFGGIAAVSHNAGIQCYGDVAATDMRLLQEVMDEAQYGVRVLGVAPGSVDTLMLRRSIALDPDPAVLSTAIDAMRPLGRLAQPDEIASVITSLLSSGAGFMTGDVVRIDGGLLARIPGAPKSKDEA